MPPPRHQASHQVKDGTRKPCDLAGDYLPREALEIRVPDPLEPERQRLVAYHTPDHLHVYHKTRKRYFPVPKALLVGGSAYAELWQIIKRLAERTGRLPHDVCLRLVALGQQYLGGSAPPLFPGESVASGNAAANELAVHALPSAGSNSPHTEQ